MLQYHTFWNYFSAYKYNIRKSIIFIAKVKVVCLKLIFRNPVTNLF